jgi:hypothetical protein
VTPVLKILGMECKLCRSSLCNSYIKYSGLINSSTFLKRQPCPVSVTKSYVSSWTRMPMCRTAVRYAIRKICVTSLRHWPIIARDVPRAVWTINSYVSRLKRNRGGVSSAGHAPLTGNGVLSLAFSNVVLTHFNTFFLQGDKFHCCTQHRVCTCLRKAAMTRDRPTIRHKPVRRYTFYANISLNVIVYLT